MKVNELDIEVSKDDYSYKKAMYLKLEYVGMGFFKSNKTKRVVACSMKNGSMLRLFEDKAVKNLQKDDDGKVIVKNKKSGAVYSVKKFNSSTQAPATKKELEKSKAGEAQKGDEEEKPKQKKGESRFSSDSFDNKGEVMAVVFSGGKENYGTLEAVVDVHSGETKDIEVRMPVDPDTGKILDITKPKERKRTIEIIDKLLGEANVKAIVGIDLLKEKTKQKEWLSNKGTPIDTTKIHKWLGDGGELQAYQEILKAGVDAYMLTDSARKNDMVIIKEDKTSRHLMAVQISIKTVEGTTHLNKMGASAKADVDAAFKNAEKQDVEIEGVGKVKGSTIVNSAWEIRKAIIKHLSAGKVFQDTDKKSKIEIDGKVMLYAEWEREVSVKPEDIEAVFENDDIFLNPKRSPIRGINDEPLSEEKINGLRKHFKSQLMAKGDMKVVDLQSWSNDNLTSAQEETGATFGPNTDILGTSWERGKGFVGNTVITMENQKQKFKDALKVSDLSEVSPADQLKHVVGLRYTGRGMGNKKAGKGHFDAQQFGTPNKKLAADSIDLSKYLEDL